MLIILVGAVGFGVRWGDPVAAAALVLCWALLGTAAGMLSGTVFRTPEQASAIGPALGIALGMLGGCMWPLEIVGDTMRRVGHLVPHAWAVDAWTTLLSRNGSLADIGTDLTVLLGFSIVLLTAAALRLRLVLRS
jgi:ABC-2 type transport system permease protein